MPDNYEERARKGLEDLARLDPEIAALDREELVREVAAGLQKAETAWGGPGRSWPGTWALMKAPFTGRLNGVEVERGLWPLGIILLKGSAAVFGPIFGLVQGIGFWNLSRSGYDARVTESGLEVFSKRKGLVATHAWSEIAQLRRIFQPPLTLWEIVLKNGRALPLPLAQLDPAAFRNRGIVVHEEDKFRSEYEKDG